LPLASLSRLRSAHSAISGCSRLIIFTALFRFSGTVSRGNREAHRSADFFGLCPKMDRFGVADEQLLRAARRGELSARDGFALMRVGPSRDPSWQDLGLDLDSYFDRDCSLSLSLSLSLCVFPGKIDPARYVQSRG